jgi:hypothetical protein
MSQELQSIPVISLSVSHAERYTKQLIRKAQMYDQYEGQAPARSQFKTPT